MSASVLILVTHLLGIGHLQRAAALGRALRSAGHAVTLVSGGRPAPLVDTDGLRLVQLPPVHCRDADFTRILGEDGEPIDGAYRERRIGAILAAFAQAAPAVVVTETYPFGRRALRAEFEALLDAAEARPDPPAVLASIRDILNPPSRPEKAVEAERVVRERFAGILVHGDEDAAPLRLSWPATAALERRLVYTGLLGGERTLPGAAATDEVLVSGGGSAAGLPLFEAALGAAALDGGAPWRILVGHGVPEDAFAVLRAHAGRNALVERARADFAALLAGCAVSVSQAGYNTALDLRRSGARAVLVPFEDGSEQEQRIRAEGLAASGRASLVRAAELSPGSLLAAVRRERARPRPAAGAAPDGAPRAVAAIVQADAERRRAVAAWDALERRLDAAPPAGIRFWWRDDDAAEPSAALDRLLALAARHAVPLALAVSPALGTAALADRLRAEPGVAVLAHGYAHRNHAPPGERKRELGGRPEAETLGELREGLRIGADRFGERWRPVLVPPWNRIDDALVPRLHALGYRGLSTFRARPAAMRDRLAVANTHCDPVWWRGGGGLAAEADLVEAFTRDLALPEPVGLLTHHLVHDGRLWRFVERLVGLMARSPAVRTPPVAELFGL